MQFVSDDTYELIKNITKAELIATDDAGRGCLTGDVLRVIESACNKDILLKNIFLDAFKNETNISDVRFVVSVVSQCLHRHEKFSVETLRAARNLLHELCLFPQFNTAHAILKKRFQQKIADVVGYAFLFTGLLGTVSVDQGSTDRVLLNVSDGYSFPCKILVRRDEIIEKSHVLIVDGAIERVSEIHTVLDYFATTKQPIVFVCRRVHDEIVRTISLNNARKTLDASVVIVDETDSDVNAIVDLAIACGSDVINSLKGQIISSIDPSEFPSVDRISFSTNRISVQNAAARGSVLQHISHLKRSIDTSVISRGEDATIRRLRTLSGKHATIHVPCRMRFSSDVMYEEFARAIASFRSLLARGYINKIDSSENSFLKLCTNESFYDEIIVNDILLALSVIEPMLI